MPKWDIVKGLIYKLVGTRFSMTFITRLIAKMGYCQRTHAKCLCLVWQIYLSNFHVTDIIIMSYIVAWPWFPASNFSAVIQYQHVISNSVISSAKCLFFLFHRSPSWNWKEKPLPEAESVLPQGKEEKEWRKI